MNSVLRTERNELRSTKESRSLIAAVCGLLVLAVVLVFCQTLNYDFVNYDDDNYVYDNDHLNQGFTWHGFQYFVWHWHGYTYHPLTTYSHMLDCQLFGLRPGWHHAVNILLHALNAMLLFLVTRRMTGCLWPSALLAAVFAVHPLHVQSVAWIAERKDVLSGLFFFLTLGAYVRYVQSLPPQRWVRSERTCSRSVVRTIHQARRVAAVYFRYVRVLRAKGRYATVCLLFALGLLAKPMLVTLPMILLLLDYWPLRRCKSPRCLMMEKLPLLMLSLAGSALTLHTQVGAIRSLEEVTFPARIANSVIAYANYLGCSFWPQRLAVLYPLPSGGFSPSEAWKKAGILLAISAGLFLCRRRAPYLLMGWLWYLGMLVPVIGLVQVGGQSMADRYMYLPQIGLAWGLVWAGGGLADWLVGPNAEAPKSATPTVGEGSSPTMGPWRPLPVSVVEGAEGAYGKDGLGGLSCVEACGQPPCEDSVPFPSDGGRVVRLLRGCLGLAAVGIVAALAVAAWQEASYWRNSETLWNRDISMYANTVAHFNLGLALAAASRHQEAVEQYKAGAGYRVRRPGYAPKPRRVL